MDNRRLSSTSRGQGSTITKRRELGPLMMLRDSEKAQRLAPVQFRTSPHKKEVNMCKSKEVQPTIEAGTTRH